MTNEELKKKIVDILNKIFTERDVIPVHTAPDGKKTALPDELCEIFNKIVVQAVIPYFADALIAAGIRDMSDIRSLAENVILSVIAHKAEVSSMEQRAKEAELRAEVAESELERYTGLIKPLEDENTRLNHRAEVAERALDRACEKVFLLSDNCRYSNLKDDVRDSIKLRRSDVENFIAVVREKFLQQAEKELEEEREE